MKQKLIVQPASDHVVQWAGIKRLYVRKRKSDAGANRKAIPRTTYADVMQLTRYWHGQYLSEMIANPRALDKDLASRKRWVESKRKLDRQLAGADPAKVYPENEWFWQEATRGLAVYLQSRKAVPGRAELMVSAVRESASEQLAAAKHAVTEVVSDVAGEAGQSLWSAIKTGTLILGGLAGAAIVIPPVVRAIRDR